MPRFSIVLLSLLAVGCALDNRRRGDVTISDMNPFEIVAVDGQAPRRWHHSIVTVLPAVLVEPGTHTYRKGGDDTEYTMTVEAGKSYRTEYTDDGVPMIVEGAR
jgi:hypothetical protein